MLTMTMTIVIDHLVDQYWPGSIVQGGQTVVAFHIDVGTVVNLGTDDRDKNNPTLNYQKKSSIKNIWTIIRELF